MLYHAFGVREGYEYLRTEYHQGAVEFHLGVAARLLVGPRCQGRELIHRGKRWRRIQTVPIGLKPVFLVTEVARCECRACRRVFEVAPPLPRRMCTTPRG